MRQCCSTISTGSNITPLFFVECLADLEKQIKSTPEQLVGSLALRTPATLNIHGDVVTNEMAEAHSKIVRLALPKAS